MIDHQNSLWKVSKLVSPVDGILIRYAVMNRSSHCRRALVFSNGRTEWIEKYTEFFSQDLGIPEDVMIVAIDHRGQGDSEGSRAHATSYKDYTQDLLAVIERTCNHLPYDLICHSMGGLIGMCALLDKQIKPERFITSGPLFGLPNSPVPRIVARPLASILSSVGLNELGIGVGSFEKVKFEDNILTSDPRKWEIVKSNPFPIPGPTFGWVHATFNAIDEVFVDTKISSLTCPVLILVGEREEVVDRNSIYRWAELAKKLSQQTIAIETIADGKHELFFEGGKIYSTAIEHVKKFLTS
jgi:lysophospholipase